MDQKYECKTIDGNTGYFHFLDGSDTKTYEHAFQDFMELVSKPEIIYLIVRNDHSGQWNKEIENIWIETGRMCDKFDIKKWGVVVPDSAIRKMTLKRVVNQGSMMHKAKYEIYLSESEDDVIGWIRQAAGQISTDN